jgi:peptidoglycan DL-endopeptidase CwlO
LVIAASVPFLEAGRAAVADPLSDAQAEANQLSAQIQAEGQTLDIASQQYDAAEQQVQTLTSQINQVQGKITTAKHKVSVALGNLRHEAIAAYVNGSDSDFDNLFVSGSTGSVIAQQYQAVAAGNLSNDIDAVHHAEATLQVLDSSLQSTQSQAQNAASQASSAEQSAQAAQQQQQQSLSQVKGQIATLVAQQQQEEEIAQQKAFEAKVAAEQAAQQAAAQQAAQQAAANQQAANQQAANQQAANQAAANQQASANQEAANQQAAAQQEAPQQTAPANTSSDDGSSAPTESEDYVPPPDASGGAAAVAAAESQLGVPYVWGGETPGVGFDCSGLTQWAWAQAGVSLPRTAADQYDAITHISLDDLEPGDLLFWNDGTSSIQHVAMYVGGGEVIQAPETGETVSYAGIWDSGLVGAGRP